SAPPRLGSSSGASSPAPTQHWHTPPSFRPPPTHVLMRSDVIYQFCQALVHFASALQLLVHSGQPDSFEYSPPHSSIPMPSTGFSPNANRFHRKQHTFHCPARPVCRYEPAS